MAIANSVLANTNTTAGENSGRCDSNSNSSGSSSKSASRKQLLADAMRASENFSVIEEEHVDRPLHLPMRQLSQSIEDCLVEKSCSDLSSSARFMSMEDDLPMYTPMRQLSKNISNRLLEISGHSTSTTRDVSSSRKAMERNNMEALCELNQTTPSFVIETTESTEIDDSFQSFGFDNSFQITSER